MVYALLREEFWLVLSVYFIQLTAKPNRSARNKSIIFMQLSGINTNSGIDTSDTTDGIDTAGGIGIPRARYRCWYRRNKRHKNRYQCQYQAGILPTSIIYAFLKVSQPTQI